jgi:hypothetical protein
LVGFKRCPETKHFSGSIVEAVSDFVEVFLGVDAQVDPLGKILADEAIGVFVGRALPWAVRVAEVDLDFQLVSQFGVSCHFLSLIAGHEQVEQRTQQLIQIKA